MSLDLIANILNKNGVLRQNVLIVAMLIPQLIGTDFKISSSNIGTTYALVIPAIFLFAIYQFQRDRGTEGQRAKQKTMQII